MGYRPLVVQCLPLVDLHHFCLTKGFPKTHSPIQLIKMPSTFCIHQIVPGFVVYYLNHSHCKIIQLSSRGTPQKSKFLVILGSLDNFVIYILFDLQIFFLCLIDSLCMLTFVDYNLIIMYVHANTWRNIFFFASSQDECSNNVYRKSMS